MDGLNGVIFVEGLHYFPFILLNLVAALRNIDGAMEEAGAESRRARLPAVPPRRVPARDAGLRRRRRARVRQGVRRPRHAARARTSPTCSRRRPTCASPRSGIEDPIGYVISVVMIVFSIVALSLSAQIAQGPRLRDAAAAAAPALQRRRLLAAGSRSLAYGWIVLVLLLVLSPHLGILLLSLAKVWSFSRAARGVHARALRHRAHRFHPHDRQHARSTARSPRASTSSSAPRSPTSCCARSSPAASGSTGRASAALAIPGIVLAIGYLRTFRGRRAAVHRAAR